MPTSYTSGYRPFDFDDFSLGLNLRDKSDAVKDGEAIDLLNVTFTEQGAIRQRDGYADLSNDLVNRVDSMAAHYTTAGLRQLMLGCGTRVDIVNEGGGAVGASAGWTRGPWTFAQFGDPTRELVFCANGVDPVLVWDGAAFTGGAGPATVNGAAGQPMPKAGAICVTASAPGSTSGTNASNRLIATAYGTVTNGGPGGGAGSSTPSRVHFSNAGQPFFWELDGDIPTGRGRNFIDLTPGDGEYIIAAVTWRELVFIFKQTKFFVLWGEGIGANNTPTFQVREVVNSIGLVSPQAVAVGRDGVYFMNRRGVYRTSGGDPVLLSDVISPMWEQNPDPYFRSRPINLSQLGLVRALWHMERFYLAFPSGTAVANDRVLVYDTQHNWWSLYDMPAAALASFRSEDRPAIHLGYAGPLPQRVGRQILNSVTDRGQVMTSRWRSGWGDYGTSQVKTIRETKLWGTGALKVAFSTDFYLDARATLDANFSPSFLWIYAKLTAAGGTYADLKLAYSDYDALAERRATRPLVERTMVRYAVRGNVFSTEFASSPQAPSWSIHRIARHMREIREASVAA